MLPRRRLKAIKQAVGAVGFDRGSYSSELSASGQWHHLTQIRFPFFGREFGLV